MLKLLSLFRFLSLLRITILSFTVFVLIQAVFEMNVPYLRFWIHISLIMSLLHIFTEILRYSIVKNAQIITTAFLISFWYLFLELSGTIIFMEDNTYRLQLFLSSITLGVTVIYLYQNLRRSFWIFAKIKIGSRLLITLSFLVVIAIGTALLSLPISHSANVSGINMIDAFFTAVSAVCVTGLTVLDTATQFSRFGQIVILSLIQIGALGLVTITTMFIGLLGQNISVTGQMSTKDSMSIFLGSRNLTNFLTFTLSFTVVVELLIAGIMFLRFYQILPLGDAIFFSIFHAISAFCNAGFALFSDSMMGFRGDYLINMAIIIAIIVGGLGFGVWSDLYSRFIEKTSKKLLLNSIIAIRVSIFMTIIGAILFFILEKNSALKDFTLHEQILSSIFSAVNLRTAGFNSISLAETGEASRLLSLLWMYIGASPGSTGGGIKTTTFIVVAAAIFASIRNDKDIIVFGRRIENSLVAQSWNLILNSWTWIFCVTLIISAIEKYSLSQILYETVSAYATVGVSTGITPELSSVSKMLIAVTMILGRVGPTTIMLAFIGRRLKKSLISIPAESVAIG